MCGRLPLLHLRFLVNIVMGAWLYMYHNNQIKLKHFIISLHKYSIHELCIMFFTTMEVIGINMVFEIYFNLVDSKYGEDYWL